MNIIKRLTKPVFNTIKLRTRSMLGLPLYPHYVQFDITKNCNSRCKYCDIWHNKKVGDNLTFEEIKKVFSDPILKNVEYIVVTGGEPTLRNDLLNVYEILHKCCPKATLQLSTNGINNTKVLSLAQHLMKEGIKFDVGISLDGVGKDHDEIRGIPGNFEKVEWLVTELNKLKEQYPKLLTICLGMTISDLTVDKYPSIKQYAKDKNTKLEYAWIEQSPYYDNDNKNINVTMNGITDIVNDLPNTPRKAMWLKDIKKKSIRYNCYALRTFFVLKYNGDVAPCIHYYNNTVGNVKEKSISKILQSNECKYVKKCLVKPCPGCLNTWAFAESNMAELTPYIWYYLKHPNHLVEELRRK